MVVTEFGVSLEGFEWCRVEMRKEYSVMGTGNQNLFGHVSHALSCSSLEVGLAGCWLS